MNEKENFVFDLITTVIGVSAAGASTMDNVEQIGRIVLVGVSVVSGIMLILVNWQKAADQVKKFLK